MGPKHKIFISYRREDSAGSTGRLYDSLKRCFGDKALFKDVYSIKGADHFPTLIKESIKRCQVVLVIIGPKFLTVKDNLGRSRIFEADDFVNTEISLSIKHKKIILPILLDDAKMPAKEELPENLSELASLNAFSLRNDRWDPDIRSLVKRLEKLSGIACIWKRRFLWMLLSLLVLFSFVLLFKVCKPDTAGQELTSLDVRVEDSEEQTPLSGVEVTIKQGEFHRQFMVNDGKIVLKDSVPVGVVYYTATKSGYDEIKGSLDITREGDNILTLEMNKTNDERIVLVRVKVTDASERKRTDAKVEVSIGTHSYLATVNASGVYQIEIPIDESDDHAKDLVITATSSNGCKGNKTVSLAEGDLVEKELELDCPKRPVAPPKIGDTGTETIAGKVYEWVILKDGNKWLRKDLVEVDEYYTFNEAKEACPQGWKLPSDHEWREMINKYGGAYNAPKQNGQPDNVVENAGVDAYESLSAGGESKFSAGLNGYFHPTKGIENKDKTGYYWTRTDAYGDEAWYYHFGSLANDISAVARSKNKEYYGFSCRCIKE